MIAVSLGGLLALSACGGGDTVVLPVTEPPVEPEIEVAPEITDQDSEEAARLAAEGAARLAAEEAARLAAEEARREAEEARLAAEEAARNLRPDVLPALPLQQVHHAHQAPVVDLDTGQDRYQRNLSGIRHVGGEIAPSGSLADITSHGAVAVSHGVLRDGVGREQVVAWLEENVDFATSWGPGFPGLPILPALHTVRVVEGASDQHQEYLTRAVQAVDRRADSTLIGTLTC